MQTVVEGRGGAGQKADGTIDRTDKFKLKHLLVTSSHRGSVAKVIGNPEKF